MSWGGLTGSHGHSHDHEDSSHSHSHSHYGGSSAGHPQANILLGIPTTPPRLASPQRGAGLLGMPPAPRPAPSQSLNHQHSHDHGHSHSHDVALHLPLNESSLQTFHASRFHWYSPVLDMFSVILQNPSGKKVALFLGFDLLMYVALFAAYHHANILCLLAFSFRIIYDIIGLVAFLVSIWAKKQKPDFKSTFGMGRADLLIVFGASLFCIFFSILYIAEESIERIFLEPEEICSDYWVFSGIFAFSFDIVGASLSSRFQPVFATHRGTRSRVCGVLSYAALGLALVAIYFDPGMLVVDTIAALFIVCLTALNVFPIFLFVSRILLQTVTEDKAVLLDTSLRRLTAVDGILETKNEHFWLLTPDKMAGYLHIRIRRDVDEQTILSQVLAEFKPLISSDLLTVQMVKDEFALPALSSPSRRP